LDKVLNEVESVDRMCPLSSEILVSELLKYQVKRHVTRWTEKEKSKKRGKHWYAAVVSTRIVIN